MFNKLPNDDFFENIDPLVKMWMYYSWVEDSNEKLDLAKNHGVLVGSFFNPEAAKRMVDDKNSSKFESTDKDYEESWKQVVEYSSNEEGARGSRRRRARKKVIK